MCGLVIKFAYVQCVNINEKILWSNKKKPCTGQLYKLPFTEIQISGQISSTYCLSRV